MTVPGVGQVAALTVMTGIQPLDAWLQRRGHFGLTPGKYASGEIDRNGAISKCGGEMVREALFEAAHMLLTRVKRKLAILLHRMWVTGEDSRWITNAG